MDTFFEFSPNALFLIFRDTLRFVAVNENAALLLDYPRAKFADLALGDVRSDDNNSLLASTDSPARYTTSTGATIFLKERSSLLDYHGKPCLLVSVEDVTQAHLNNLEMKQANLFLSLLSDSARDIVVVIDADGCIKFANNSIERILNFRPSECLGMSASSLVHPDDQKKLGEAIGAATSGSPARVVFRHIHADGQWRWIDAVITDHTNEPVINGYLLVGRDITSRYEMESELRLRDDAMNAADNGIMIADVRLLDEPMVYVNPAFERITGYSAEEVIGKNVRFLQGKERQQPARKVLRSAIETGTASSVVLLNYRKDGTPFWNELHISPIHDDSGVVSHYVGIQNDVTYRTVIEQALRESQERFDEIVSSVNDIVYSVSLDASVALYISPAIREVLGFTTEDMYAGNHQWRGLVHPDDLSFAESSWRELNREGRIERELRYVDASGGTHTIYERAVVVRDAAGLPLRIDGIASDISEQKQMRQNVIQAEKLSALGELVAGVAHEINNPLTIISGHAQILEMTQEGAIKQDATTILRMAKRASDIVRNLLTFARRSEGTLSPGSVVAAVVDALDLVAYRLATHGVNIEKHLDDTDSLVMMNATEIQQVVFNLISNADHAVSKRQPSDRNIKVSTYRTRDETGKLWMVVSIADNGYGMTEDLKSRIFDPFFTTKEVGQGTGLGLSICHGIVQTHGGKIIVHSAEGQGTTMEILFPIFMPEQTVRVSEVELAC